MRDLECSLAAFVRRSGAAPADVVLARRPDGGDWSKNDDGSLEWLTPTKGSPNPAAAANAHAGTSSSSSSSSSSGGGVGASPAGGVASCSVEGFAPLRIGSWNSKRSRSLCVFFRSLKEARLHSSELRIRQVGSCGCDGRHRRCRGSVRFHAPFALPFAAAVTQASAQIRRPERSGAEPDADKSRQLQRGWRHRPGRLHSPRCPQRRDARAHVPARGVATRLHSRLMHRRKVQR